MTTWCKFAVTDKDKRKLLKSNEKFKDIHSGKRCFILGNGPSLKDVDFSLLTDEYVFTVNQISRKEGFEKLKTNYHFWADPNFFKIDTSKPEDAELLNAMKALRTPDNKPTVFFPMEQYDFVKKHGLDHIFDIAFFKSGLKFHPDFESVDYTKMVPSFGTVVQWCMTAAIYMGFEEIYLLGMDNTSIVANINAMMNNPVTEYGYAVTENEKKRLEKMVSDNFLYVYASSYAQLLLDYINLYEVCTKKGIRLFNCTQKSAIDLIPHKKLEEVVGKNNHGTNE